MIRKYIKKYSPNFLKNTYHAVYNTIFNCYCYLTRKVVLHIYAGIPLKVYIYNPVSKLWYDHDENRSEIAFLQKNELKKDARVFNIGAHHGIIALILSKIVGNNGTVVAVEMDSKHIKTAKINKENNNAFNLHLVLAAIGEKKMQTYFNKDQILNKSDEDSARKVRMLSVDELTKKYGDPNLIYMDVEGYECHVLEGAKKTLKYYPDVFIEVHVKNGLEQFNGSIEEIVSHFPNEQYDLFMGPPVDNCKFQRFNPKNELTKNRFYLVAFSKKHKK